MGYAQVQRSEPNVIEQNAFGKYIMTLSQSWVKLGNVHAGIGFLVVKIKLILMNIENIKFKAKCLDSGEWVEGNLRTSKSGNAMIIPIEYSGAYPVDPSTVCQFTGLTDSDGIEIWEGDILRCTTGSLPPFYVYFSDFGTFCIRREANGIVQDMYLFELSNNEHSIKVLRVIGNIFNKKK